MADSKVVIVMARCTVSKKDYGIRFENHGGGQWVGDWAFAIKAETAQREGYDRNSIAGTFQFANAYPGCPSCEAGGIVKCNCQQVACWDTQTKTHKCPWCGLQNRITGTIENLNAGGDR
jgi:hypothetical protein